jgi:hypothetical protein
MNVTQVREHRRVVGRVIPDVTYSSVLESRDDLHRGINTLDDVSVDPKAVQEIVGPDWRDRDRRRGGTRGGRRRR